MYRRYMNSIILLVCCSILMIKAPALLADGSNVAEKPAGWQVVSHGGNQSKTASLTLISSVGQTATGMAVANGTILVQGYIQNFSIQMPVCGDINSDGLANVADAVFLTRFIFSPEKGINASPAGDDNCDGVINITDAVFKISFIFSGGNAPGDPLPAGAGDCANDLSCNCVIPGCL